MADTNLSILNHPARVLPGPKLLHELILQSSLASPTAKSQEAIDFLPCEGGIRRTFTYTQLDQLSTRFAQKLQLQPGRSSIVPVLIPQSPKLYIALLGILKAGGAFAPLQLDVPVERIRFVVADVGAQVIVADSSFPNKLSWEGAPTVVIVDEDDIDITSLVHNGVNAKATVPIHPTSPAYVMYTSGSTGTPKGVLISHSAATQSLIAHEKHIPAYNRFLQFASPSFDVFVFEVFFTFFRGATLVGCERSRLLSNIVDIVNKLDIDALELTPTVLGELVVSRDRIPKVKTVLTIGEMLTRHIVDEFGDGLLHGMYGPTEAAIHCTLATNFRKGGAVGDAGVPLDTVSAFILGPSTPGSDVTVLPIGWVGELAVGGYQLADGYLNRPEQTRDVFIDTKYGRLYRTGDRARMHPGGTIECFGRISCGQVKLRGQRVELGEVEEAIRKAPGARGVVASVISGSLVAFVGGGCHVTELAVREAARKWLPKYMVPSAVVVMEEIPKVPSGKADRKRLEKEFLENRSQGETGKGEDAVNDTEKIIANTISEVLGIALSRDASFIANGLDSLLAIRVCSKLRGYGLTPQVADILRADCVKELALSLTTLTDVTSISNDTVDIITIYKDVRDAGWKKLQQYDEWNIDDVEDIIPCTPVQELMLAETMRDSTAYSNWILLELPVSYSDNDVELAFRKLIRRNEILRTGFVHLEHRVGMFAQIVWESARENQFTIATTVNSDYHFNVEDMLDPPLRAFLIRKDSSLNLSVHIHHALYDGWSWDQLLKDFNRVLIKDHTNATYNRPQFREVVKYTLGRPNSKLDLCKSFWKKTLSGAPNSKLPNFHGHSDVPHSSSTQTYQLRVPRKDLEKSARELGVSPQVIVQAAWAYILGSYLHSSDVLFGTVVSGRTIPVPGIEDIIGPCISTLPMRVNLGDGKKTCTQLMREVQELNRMLLLYGELDLRQIKNLSESGSGIFDTLLIWQQTTSERGDGTKGLVRQLDSKDRSEFSLLLETEPTLDVVIMKATYRVEIIPATQLSLLLSQLDHLIASMTLNPYITLNTLSSGLDGTLLSIYNPNPIIPSMDKLSSLSSIVEKSAAEFPESIALHFAYDVQKQNCQDVKVTYQELNATSNRLAHRLIQMGAKVDDLICICMEKSPMLYISILAIVKTGAGYLPLTPDTPLERRRKILEDAGVQICLSTSDLKSSLWVPAGSTSVEVDNLNLNGLPSTNPQVEIDPSALAYAIFTSGSTGVPKGVLITQQNIVTNLFALKKVYPYSQSSRLLQFCSQAFDVSVFEIFFAWSTGICLCSATKDTLLRGLEEAINELEITHLSLTPTVAALVEPANVPKVEFVVTSGEPLTRKVFSDWAGRGLYQGYGPSETTNICTINPRMKKKHNINNLGLVLENVSVFILAVGDGFELVPRGGVGELCFGGSQVGRGYLNMPEVTASKFIKHPQYGIIYRSGDIGRLLPDDCIEFLGRLDDQVKIRGLRIELAEINSVLLRQKTVKDATTITITRDNTNRINIVSFVVLHGYPQTSTETSLQVLQNESEIIPDIFHAMSDNLPPYMVPTNVIPVTNIPMTAQGKTDKRVLQKCYQSIDRKILMTFSMDPIKKGDDQDKWTSLERSVAQIIAQFAKVPLDEVERFTSIFQLGLDSISIIHVSSQISKLGYKRPDVSQIMRNPTIMGLAALVEGIGRVTEEPTEKGRGTLDEFINTVKAQVLDELQLTASDISTILPCTPLQEAMLTQRLHENAATYYNHTVFELRVNAERLKDAWSMVMKQNDILRTCFCITSHPRHAYAQVVLKEFPIPWTEVKLDGSQDLMTTVKEQIQLVSSSLRISRPPLAFVLFRMLGLNILLMTTHHSLYDGFAMDLLLDEVRMAYNGTPLPTRKPFSSVLEFIENCDMSKADSYWKATLNGLQPFQFPDLTGKSNSYRANITGMSTVKVRSSKNLSYIEAGCKKLSTSLLALGQSAWTRLLSSYTGELDVCFGNVVSGRTIPVPGVEDIIAPCFNTIPVRVPLTISMTNEELLNLLQRGNADAMPFQLTPLRRIMTSLKTDGQMLFDTLFILQYGRESELEELWEVIDDRGEMDFSVVLELVPTRKKDYIEFILHHRRNIMDEDTARIILQQVDQVLCAVIEQPESSVNNFSNLRDSIVSLSNINCLEFPQSGDQFLHTLFEQYARTKPTATALEFLDDTGIFTRHTYDTLNKAANQVAHLLLQHGVERDEAVPIYLEKSAKYYICVLGILKAGAAFTPIDPNTPAQRVAFMFEELEARFALTNSTNIAKDLPHCDGLTFLNLDDESLASLPVSNPSVADLTPNQLAYRLYTSGSTGVPKAVSVEIRSALQTIRASRSIIPWHPKSRLLQFAAITFDMCYYDCFMAWNFGFTLCSAGRKYLLGDLEATIKRMSITLLDLTPTVASTLVAKNLPDVELLYCIGEAMPQNLVDDWEGRCVNSYGPTEVSMCCTIVPVDTTIKSDNIGQPFPTAGFMVISRDSTYTVPLLGSGELCIGGPQLSREYHNNPKLTSEKFITLESGRFYRTGDIVRMLANGTFEFIGRLDDQVKVRGLRVELDEINHVLKNSHWNVTDAVTIVSKHSTDAKEQLISFLALDGRKQHGAVPVVISDEKVREQVLTSGRRATKEALPSYMIPTIMLVIDHIPLSAAGKVDRKALKLLFSQQEIKSLGEVTTEDNFNWSDNELIAREILAEISQLPIERITKSSTIYQIGLDSISAAQVAMRLCKQGFKLTVIDILECPSIKELSSRLIKDHEGSPKTATFNQPNSLLDAFAARHAPTLKSEYGLSLNQIDGIYPCTEMQSGMLSQFLRSNGGLYFNHILFELPPAIKAAKLRHAWTELMESNDILRAGFFGIDDEQHSFATVIYSKSIAELPWTEIQFDTEAAIDKYKDQLVSQSVESLGSLQWHLTYISTPSSTKLLFSGNHALYDANSLKMMLSDAADIYLDKSPNSHPHFAATLEAILESSLDSAALEAGRSFWLKQLERSSISTFPDLNVSRVQSTTSHVASQLSSKPLSQIEGECKKLGYSLHAVAQAAWVRILSAYIGESQVAFGIVLSGRTGLVDAEDVLFPCLTTIPMLGTAIGSNHNLVTTIQRSNTKVLQYQHTPLRLIQRWLNHPDQALFDTIFVYQKMVSKRVENQSSVWKIVDENAYYSISIEVEPTENDRLFLRATCRDSVMPLEQSKLLVQQLDAAILDIIANPDHDCTLFSNFPRELLSISPPTVREIPCDVTFLHQFVEKYAKLKPQKIALEFATKITETFVEKKQWNYQQLDNEGNKVANFLLKRGVKTGGLVGICFDKCAEASFAILGILKAGCGYVALDPSAPIDRKVFIVQDSGAQCILTMNRFLDDLRERVEVGVYSVADGRGIQASSTKQPCIVGLRPDHLCYCLYTSGTTGTPKGCELTHENAVQAMLAFQRIFEGHWDEESRFLQFASFHFDVSVLEQFWSWSVGACVTSTPRDLLFEDLTLAISKLEVTHLDLTPSLAALLNPDDVPTLRRGVFIVGGEALKQDVLDTWGKHGVLYNGYGPTEVTIGCTMLPHVPQDGKPSNIGPQFDNVGSFVMAPNANNPLLRGAIGELCVFGKLVGKGYLNRFDLTQEKFPYLEQYGERVYRTGDLVRILHNGCFDFAGRADDQVKLRGQRLEIGEINITIKRADPKVKAVATLVLKHPKQQKDQLVSFISFEDSTTKNTSPCIVTTGNYTSLIGTILSTCKKHLPVYMIPTHFLPISEIPLSVNNKVDNKRLKLIYEEAPLELIQSLTYNEEKEAPRSKSELQIQAILARMARLQVSEIKRSSTIFELGLDSVSVVSLARRLKKSGFGGATVSGIMQNSTLEQLAQFLSGSANNTKTNNNIENIRQKLSAFANNNSYEVCEQLGITQDKIQQILPCSPLQEGMILRFIDSDQPLYFNSFTFELTTYTNIDVLKESWATVANATDILRTCFCETADGYAQVVLNESHLNWTILSFDKEEDLDEVLEKERNHVAHLNRSLHEPPIYFKIIHAKSRSILVINIFHALYDGNSLPLILKDVQDAYHSKYYRRPCQFPQVLPYILSCDLKEAEGFWMKHLRLKRFAPFPRSTQAVGADFTIQRLVAVDGNLIHDGCMKLGCTAQSIVQTAWASVLASYFGHGVTFGVVISGRTLPLDGVEGTIGPLFNTIPCFINVSDNVAWKDLVKQTHLFNAESVSYHHTPFRLIRKWLALSGPQQLFDTLFVYQRLTSEDNTSSSPLWKPIQTKADPDYPLSLEVEHHSDGKVYITVAVKGGILKHDQALNLISQCDNALKSLLDDPDGKPRVADKPKPGEIPAETHNAQSNRDKAAFEWTPEAFTMKRVIATLTGLEESEVTENASIFELGLDSIEAIKLSARLRRSGLQIPVSTIMRNPTIRKMCLVLQEAAVRSQKVSEDVSLLGFEVAARKKFPEAEFEAIYPTTPLQEAMIAETLASDYKFYFNHDVLELDPSVDPGRLRLAWEMVIQSNPILRTNFFQVHELGISSPYAFGQVAHRKFEVPWTHIQLSRGDDLWLEIQEAMDQAASAASLLNHPPIQLTFLKARNSSYLLLSISHALYDGWSLRLLHEDVQRAYHSSLQPRPSPMPLIEIILGNNAEESSQYWKQILQGIEVSEFPILSNSTELPQTHRHEIISKADYTKISQFCKRLGITSQTLGQTCWGLILAHYLRKPDLVFGTVLSGRDTEQAEQIMFPAMNTIPVRVIAHGSYRGMLQYMQDNSGNVLKHQHTPLRMIQKLVNSGRQRLFDTLFIYQRGQDSPQMNKLYHSIKGNSDLEYNICIEMEREGNNLIWRAACKSSVLSMDEVENMLQTLDSLLLHMMDYPDFPAVTYEDNIVRFGNTQPLPIYTPLIEPNVTQTATPKEVKVLGTWSAAELKIRKVLSLVAQIPEDEIERNQTIFHLGLDSISAIRVCSELRKEGIVLSVAEILRHTTIEKMAWATEEKEKAEDVPADVINTERALKNAIEGMDVVKLLEGRGVKYETVEKVMPATAGQIHMLSTWQNSSGGLFMPTFSFKSRKLDNRRLETAWRTLVREESILRTTFISTGIERPAILQIVFSDPSVQFESQEVVTSNLQELISVGIAREQQKEVSLKKPPVRLTLVNTSTESVILLTIHHALYDGVSLPLLLKKLRRIYNKVPVVMKQAQEIIKAEIAVQPAAEVQAALTLPSALSQQLEPLPLLAADSYPTSTEVTSDTTTSSSTPIIIPTANTTAPASLISIPANSVLTSLPTFADVVAYTSSRDRTKQERFWTTYLDGAVSTLLSSRTKSAPINTTQQERSCVFNPKILNNVTFFEEQCRKNGITLQALFLAAFAKVYADILFPKHDSSNTDESVAMSEANSPQTSSNLSDVEEVSREQDQDVVIGVYLSSRHLPVTQGTESLYDLAAPTLNLLPLRLKNPKTTGLHTLARRIQKGLGEIGNAENSGGVGVADIEKWTRNSEGEGMEGVRVDVWFNYLKLPGTGIDPENGDSEEAESDCDEDEWAELEEVKPEIPVMVGEARESQPNGINALSKPVGADMLGTNVVRKHIMNNLDVEVAVIGDNIGLGVFARGDLLGTDEVASIMRKIRETVGERLSNEQDIWSAGRCRRYGRMIDGNAIRLGCGNWVGSG
ncbi:hypothetical protein BDZ91DRAFT_422141 [Kalaharituber pfeilii]|nr:hypothetical protein BDZ91DRAFT_422141 [Kalaharituber pfeilii]